MLLTMLFVVDDQLLAVIQESYNSSGTMISLLYGVSLKIDTAPSDGTAFTFLKSNMLQLMQPAYGFLDPRLLKSLPNVILVRLIQFLNVDDPGLPRLSGSNMLIKLLQSENVDEPTDDKLLGNEIFTNLLQYWNTLP